ncbi:hypothetical protein Ancab_026008 [Ancistrocladus abbreviatus]
MGNGWRLEGKWIRGHDIVGQGPSIIERCIIFRNWSGAVLSFSRKTLNGGGAAAAIVAAPFHRPLQKLIRIPWDVVDDASQSQCRRPRHNSIGIRAGLSGMQNGMNGQGGRRSDVKQSGATFADVVRSTGQRSLGKNDIDRKMAQSLQKCNLAIKSSSFASEWLKGSFTGVLKPRCLLPNMFERMVSATAPFCAIRPIGGRLVLLTASGEFDMASVVAHNWDKLSLWFDEVRPWRKEDIGGSRLAVVRCSGVPLHV